MELLKQELKEHKSQPFVRPLRESSSETQSLQSQIKLLQERCSHKDQHINEITNELELIKLEKLSEKPQPPSESTRHLNTRDLIKRDKRMWKLKTFAIDQMSHEQSHDLLKLVCLNLDVHDIERLPAALEDIDKTLRLIPQMQKVIVCI